MTSPPWMLPSLVGFVIGSVTAALLICTTPGQAVLVTPLEQCQALAELLSQERMQAQANLANVIAQVRALERELAAVTKQAEEKK